MLSNFCWWLNHSGVLSHTMVPLQLPPLLCACLLSGAQPCRSSKTPAAADAPLPCPGSTAPQARCPALVYVCSC